VKLGNDAVEVSVKQRTMKSSTLSVVSLACLWLLADSVFCCYVVQYCVILYSTLFTSISEFGFSENHIATRNVEYKQQTRGLGGNETAGIPRGNRGNGDHIHGNTAGTGSRFTGLPWGWGSTPTVMPR